MNDMNSGSSNGSRRDGLEVGRTTSSLVESTATPSATAARDSVTEINSVTEIDSVTEINRREVLLESGWQLCSSAELGNGSPANGAALSGPSAPQTLAGWHTIPRLTTVLGGLVDSGAYEDPFTGDNLLKIPGHGPRAKNFSHFPMPQDSPFRQSWWYRTSFMVPAAGEAARHQAAPANGTANGAGNTAATTNAGAGLPQHYWLRFDGINYRANVWLNGQQIASAEDVVGAYRVFEFEVTGAIRRGVNTLAVEVFAPEPDDLALTWVDWNPSPPDKSMGLWRDVAVLRSGPVAIRDPQVRSELSPEHQRARLFVTANAVNATDRPQQVEVIVTIRPPGAANRQSNSSVAGDAAPICLRQSVTLEPRESRELLFDPSAYPELDIEQPRLWWPRCFGPQHLYELEAAALTPAASAGNGQAGDNTPRRGGVAAISDCARLRFGIRQVTSELTSDGDTLFRINGEKILIRGAGWANDMFLRSDREREEAELAYVIDMNLNTIRFEGMLARNRFLSRCDEEGILVIGGWCCCDLWEKWGEWRAEHHDIARESLRSQIRRIRNHPCLVAWWYGSDLSPPEDVERSYLAVLKEERWPNPAQSSAADKPTELTGSSGMKMSGPYDYVPPAYWLHDTERGGAFGFATEVCPGPAVPPLESLRRMLPAEHHWPIDDVWNYHAGGHQFDNIKLFTDAMTLRYGEAKGIEDYARKAQLMAYEGQRAMFEAFGRNRFRATGVIQWMLNNAWPSLIWHLYDYYLRPAGGYFGTKQACEPIHIQYSYDDRSVVVVNDSLSPTPRLTAIIKIVDLDGREHLRLEKEVQVGPNRAERIELLPIPAEISRTYFVRLELAVGLAQISTNTYWLSTQPEILDHANGNWYTTPTSAQADYTALATMPTVEVATSWSVRVAGQRERVRVQLRNPCQSVAFFIELCLLLQSDQTPLLPVFWKDNYVSLLPGETRIVEAEYDRSLRGNTPVCLQISGVNVERTLLPENATAPERHPAPVLAVAKAPSV